MQITRLCKSSRRVCLAVRSAIKGGFTFILVAIFSIAATAVFAPKSAYARMGGTWAATGSMTTTRGYHTATQLADGKVLVAGGSHILSLYDNLSSAELYDPTSGTWSATGSMTTQRAFAKATRLASGKVLVTGGFNNVGGGGHLSSAELYDPASGTWTATGSMTTPRLYPTATLLANGKVLVAGGFKNVTGPDKSGGYLSSAELYDPASGTWTATGGLATQRANHTATLLANGKVLVAGGRVNDFTVLSSAELYDPASRTWTVTGTMTTPRLNHTDTLLTSGKVLVAGGAKTIPGLGEVGPEPYLSSAELYDPASGTWTTTGSMAIPRYVHTATLLAEGTDRKEGTEGKERDEGKERNEGKVLLTGGFNKPGGYLSSAELYDPASGTWTATGSLATPRWYHTATLLPKGKLLIAGGYNNGGGFLSSAELYHPRRDS